MKEPKDKLEEKNKLNLRTKRLTDTMEKTGME